MNQRPEKLRAGFLEHAGIQRIAVSQDGVHWEKPKLSIYPFTWKGETTKANNIVVPQTYHNGKDHWESY